MASNQTGIFPRVSNNGNKYICVLYVYNPNFIKGVSIKSRHWPELLEACMKVYKWCKPRGFKPKLSRMNNKTSINVRDFIASQNTVLHSIVSG